jgi:hypothetical protein
MLAYIEPREVARAIIRSVSQTKPARTQSDFNRQVARMNRMAGTMTAISMNNAAEDCSKRKR